MNAMGAFCQVCFTSMASIAMIPMMCYPHPLEHYSVLKYSGTLCGSPDHKVMLGLGSTLLLLVCLFFTWCLMAVWKLKKIDYARDRDFLDSTRFLFARFHMDGCWWGPFLFLRNLLLSAVPVMATSQPLIQVLITATILISSSALQIRIWPWRVPLLNVLDAFICMILVLTLTASTAFIPRVSTNEEDAFTTLMAVLVIVLYSVVGVMFGMAVISLCKRGSMGSVNDVFNLVRTPDLPHLVKKLQTWVEGVSDASEDHLELMLSELSIYDLLSMQRMLKTVDCTKRISVLSRRNISVISVSTTGSQSSEPPVTLLNSNTGHVKSNLGESPMDAEEPNNVEPGPEVTQVQTDGSSDLVVGNV